MPSFALKSRRFVLASLGFVLVVTAAFAPLGSIAWTYEYSAEQVTPDDSQLSAILYWADTTAFCKPDPNECELAYSVKNDGPRVVSEETYLDAHGFSPQTALVMFHDAAPAFYKPNVTHFQNETTKVDLIPVSNATALELASTPASRYPRGVERVIEGGTVHTNRPLAGFPLWEHTQAVIAHDGEYYTVGPFSYRGWMQNIADLLQLVILAAGVALCYHAGHID